ncbi:MULTISPECIES: LysR family transcriptional regulator [Cupriavidus]|uniref:LysR family transcriptional regulator n=1 Tax=Cupriavidus pauculus TaxID=82633 RepID=A0A5P2H2U4_9BURK|nr:LysR family transcriptional regulator [Cupriavidus pauculus]QET01843.1 LysR family transcriptional regulator [Cupriavidus pauculus]
MNTRFLETLLSLARSGSIRATARELHATPAAISSRIKALEAELGVSLVDRGSSQFRLSDDGERLLNHAREVVHAARTLQLAAQRGQQISGRLRLGVVETVVHSWLPNFVRALETDYPELVVDLTVDATAVLGPRLLAGELDLVAQVESAIDPSIVAQPLARYPVRWIARRDMLAEADGTDQMDDRVRAMLRHPVLTFGRGTLPQLAVDAMVSGLASEHGVPLSQTRVTCMPSVAAMIHLLRDGYGVAAVPSLLVAEYLDTGELVELPMLPSPPPIVIALYRRDDARVAVHAAAAVAREVCSQYCDALPAALIEAS